MDPTPDPLGGRYRLIETLGKGAMGVVYKAHDPVLDRFVAIKRMTAEFARDAGLRQRFQVEARAAARLNHPNIVTVYELGEIDGDPFIVMELLEGVPLSHIIRQRSRLPLHEVLGLVVQVADGLEYAHRNGVVHRDIKPANLHVGASGSVKILDFGIARIASVHVTASGMLIGTPDYMAPEQARGENIDHRADLFSLGAVTYELVSGIKPFAGGPLAAVLARLTREPHVPLADRVEGVPPALTALVDRLLAKDPAARPATAADARAALLAIAAESTTIVATAGPSETGAARAGTTAGGADEAAEPTVLRSAAATETTPAPRPPPAATPRPAEAPAPAAAAGASGPDQDIPGPPPHAAAGVEFRAATERPAADSEPRNGGAWRWVAAALAAVLVVGAASAWWWWRAGRPASWFGEADDPRETSQSEPPSNPTGVASARVGAGAARVPEAGGEFRRDAVAGAAGPGDSSTPRGGETEPARAVAPIAPPAATFRGGGGASVPRGADEGRGQRREGAPPAAEVEAPANRSARATAETPRPIVPLAPGTIEALTGRGGDVASLSQSAAAIAAAARIRWVLEQYAGAFERHDAALAGAYRPGLSTDERSWIAAGARVTVRFDQLRVEASETDGTVYCHRVVRGTTESGSDVREERAVVVTLVRRPAGWVITEIR